MTESYLHAIFQNKMLGSHFTTTVGKTVEIIDFGILNVNAGPDFLGAKIKLNDVVWSGHIEFHIHSSDWLKHNHQEDPAYRNVILHIVYQHDHAIYSGEYKLPTVEICGLINKEHFENYSNMVEHKTWIPCANQLQSVPLEVIESEIAIQFENRLNRKANELMKQINEQQGDEKKVFFLKLASAFGGKVNGVAFHDLFNTFHSNQFSKLNYDTERIQAMLFGVANLLPLHSNDPYENQLIKEFDYLKHLFQLKIDPHRQMKYSTMRPFGFPDIRLAQFAAILSKNAFLDDFTLNLDAIKSFLQVDLNPYWKTHFRIGNETKQKNECLSDQFIDNLVINVLLPFSRAKELLKGDRSSINAQKDIFLIVPPEKNNITKKWRELNVSVKSAYHSQALLELKNEQCYQKKCLICAIGKNILKQ